MAKETGKPGKLKVHTTLLQSKKTATGIEIPEEIVRQLGAGKKPAVKVTINGYTYRSSIAFMGGVFMLGVSAVVRENAGVKGGDKIDVDIELDTEPREITVPPDLRKALDNNADAKNFFSALSFSNKK